MNIKLEDILGVVLLTVIAVLLGCQIKEKQCKRPRYTCGIEGGCEVSVNGHYESKEECESKCGKPI